MICCVSIFFSYLPMIHSLNTSAGIMPDLRYYTPMYVPLSLVGLILIQKAGILKVPAQYLVSRLGFTWIMGIPLSLIILANMTWDPVDPMQKYEFLRNGFTAIVVFIIMVIALSLVSKRISSLCNLMVNYAFPILCALPLIWQINASFLIWQYGNAESYTFWIPVVRIAFSWL